MSRPTFSSAELAKHRSSQSCYVTIDTKVYNLTEFLGDHPGGEDVILECVAYPVLLCYCC